MWFSTRKASPRTEVVYNIEPFRGAVRRGDWKLVWRTPLPSALELYNIARDPYEKTNVAEYCVSEGWIRVAAGPAKDRFGNPLTIKLAGTVEPYFKEKKE